MATIDSAAAPWSDGAGCGRGQCTPRIADIQRKKPIEKEAGVTTNNPFFCRPFIQKKDNDTTCQTVVVPHNYMPSSSPLSLSSATAPASPTQTLQQQHHYEQQQQQLPASSSMSPSNTSSNNGSNDTDNMIDNVLTDFTKMGVSDGESSAVDGKLLPSECTVSDDDERAAGCSKSPDLNSNKIGSSAGTIGIHNSSTKTTTTTTTTATNTTAITIKNIVNATTTTTTTTTTTSTTTTKNTKCPSLCVNNPASLHIRNLPKTQSLDLADDRTEDTASKSSRMQPYEKGMMPKFDQSRPIYPNVPYSPYGSPYGSPRSGRRRPPLRESRRISIEQTGSFLQLNQYKLMDQIGQGSYGLVKLAYSEEDSTHYAMKILSKRKLLRKAGLMGRGPKKGTSPLDRVYREIAVLKKLDHPNVVKLVEVLDDPIEDSLYLVFELVQLGEVLSIPTDTPLNEERAWSVFRDALLGLEYLHYQRIIHSDIKPGNLLLGENGRVKIADLGVCNEFMGEDASMNNVSTAGTPAFRAPETLLTGQHSYSGKAADIWALGATLYALIFGKVPFLATNVPAVYEKIKNDQLVFPDSISISAELKDLIEMMLDKVPAQRITLPQIKEHVWVTTNGTSPVPSEEENCRLVQISDEDIESVVKSIPKLDTLILIKTMLKKHSFLNPFSKGVSGRAPMRGGSRVERFSRAGRSNSAPGAYHMVERQLSSDSILPSVTEGVVSPCSSSIDEAN